MGGAPAGGAFSCGDLPDTVRFVGGDVQVEVDGSVDGGVMAGELGGTGLGIEDIDFHRNDRVDGLAFGGQHFDETSNGFASGSVVRYFDLNSVDRSVEHREQTTVAGTEASLEFESALARYRFDGGCVDQVVNETGWTPE